jgi:hypothetical protein
VQADTGSIGGSESTNSRCWPRFRRRRDRLLRRHPITPPTSRWPKRWRRLAARATPQRKADEGRHPGRHTIADVATFLNVPDAHAKTLVVEWLERGGAGWRWYCAATTS